jgi:hypothetical protein
MFKNKILSEFESVQIIEMFRLKNKKNPNHRRTKTETINKSSKIIKNEIN